MLSALSDRVDHSANEHTATMTTTAAASANDLVNDDLGIGACFQSDSKRGVRRRSSSDSSENSA
jgi:hypothetical protein